ncbi:hypothetical protein DPMN_062868 [Dreissena polymorpha]|uniref:Uncharacterized protein n=1 Tax=Dreissena polymorpha TaxID=45954 RepID=A0A9D4C9G0_DREPO|nr:hypothetical protein DPMN_062868 [Dreissena polymorpha]
MGRVRKTGFPSRMTLTLTLRTFSSELGTPAKLWLRATYSYSQCLALTPHHLPSDCAEEIAIYTSFKEKTETLNPT